MRAKVTCPSCGHNADHHKITTLKKTWGEPTVIVPYKKPKDVCSMSKSFLKKTLTA